MRFEDCYPQEIVEWINTFPHPDDCTDEQRHIAQLVESPELIAIGQGLLRHLRDANSRSEARAMIENFKTFAMLGA